MVSFSLVVLFTRGGWVVKKGQNSVYVVIEWPLSCFSAKSANASIRVVLSIKGNSSGSERLTMDTDESFRLAIANEKVEIEG